MNPSHVELLQRFEVACINRSVQRDKLRHQILQRMKAADLNECSDCGIDIPKGQGIGISAPEEEWIDRSQPRPITIVPLCIGCMGKKFAAV